MTGARLKGVGCAVVSAALFGLIPLFTTSLYGAGATGFQIVCARMALSALVMGAYCVGTKQRLRYGGRSLLWLLGVAVLYALSTLCFGLALRDTSAGLMSTLYFTYPLMVLVAGAMVARRPVGLLKALAVMAAMGGTVLIFLADATWYYTAAGVALSLGSALAFALYTVALDRRALAAIPGPVVFFYGCVATVVLCLPFTLMAPLQPLLSPRSLSYVGMLALLCTVAPYLLYIRATRVIGAQDAALLSYVQLGVTVAVECGLAGLLPSPLELAGCALIVLGGMATVVERPSKASRRTSPGPRP